MGLELSRKEQDEFLLFIKVFVEKIRPPVDLVNKEDVIFSQYRSPSSMCPSLPTRSSRGNTS
jgi:hypothetical protein